MKCKILLLLLCVGLTGCCPQGNSLQEAYSFAALKGEITRFVTNGKAYHRLALEHISKDALQIVIKDGEAKENLIQMKQLARKLKGKGTSPIALINHNFGGQGYDTLVAKIYGFAYNHEKGGLSFTYEEVPASYKRTTRHTQGQGGIIPVEYVQVTLIG